jgi:predicted regulator of Ras-like GTPase activity (Roadblock/LC7/MglB family)
MEHGKRYGQDEKEEILRFRETHTFQETNAKFGVSMMTLFRWSRKSGNTQKIMKRDENKLNMIVRYNEGNTDAEFKAKAFELAKVLEVLKYIQGIKAIALINEEGELVSMLATEDFQDVDMNMIIISILAVSQRAIDQLILGKLEMDLIKATMGMLLIIEAGPSLLMDILFDENVDLKHLFSEDFTVIERVKKTIQENYP